MTKLLDKINYPSDLRKFDKKSFKALHPGGKIGKKLKTLSEIMDTDLPLIKKKYISNGSCS